MRVLLGVRVHGPVPDIASSSKHIAGDISDILPMLDNDIRSLEVTQSPRVGRRIVTVCVGRVARFLNSDNPHRPPMDEPMLVEGASLTSSSSDYFTDAQHEKKDEEVTLFVQEIFDPKQELSQAQCAILLQSIIDFSEGKLQAEYMQPARTRELLDKNPRLISALQKAWRTKNYKEIRKSGELRASSLAGI